MIKQTKGLIIKNISDSYDVLSDNKIITCKCRGIFRYQNLIPIVGDFVLIDEEKKIINEIIKRKNEIIRPRVANITKAFVVTSYTNPDFSTNLLDKLLVELEINKIKPVIIMTKKDMIDKEEYIKIKKILDYYKKIGYNIIENTDNSSIIKRF